MIAMINQFNKIEHPVKLAWKSTKTRDLLVSFPFQCSTKTTMCYKAKYKSASNMPIEASDGSNKQLFGSR